MSYTYDQLDSLDVIIEKLEDAGFGVRLDDMRLFVYLRNRPVSTTEIIDVLYCSPYKLRRVGREVEILV